MNKTLRRPRRWERSDYCHINEDLFWNELPRNTIRNTNRNKSVLTLCLTCILKNITRDMCKEHVPEEALQWIHFSDEKSHWRKPQHWEGREHQKSGVRLCYCEISRWSALPSNEQLLLWHANSAVPRNKLFRRGRAYNLFTYISNHSTEMARKKEFYYIY